MSVTILSPWKSSNASSLKANCKTAGLAIILAATFGCSTVAMAQAKTVYIRYSVSVIGFAIGGATLTGVVGPGAYKIQARAKLNGLAKAISGAKGAAQSSGVIRGGRVLPAGYATTSSNSRETRTVRMGMNAGNVRAVDISPPLPDRPGRIPVSNAHRRNIIDPLSALVFPVSGKGPINGATACNRTLPVFDGYARFNITLQHATTRNVSVKGYRGPVFICKARYKPIAGHRPSRKATKFMANNQQMEVWLAPLGGSNVLAPYKIAVNTMIGMVDITANKFIISGDPATATVSR